MRPRLRIPWRALAGVVTPVLSRPVPAQPAPPGVALVCDVGREAGPLGTFEAEWTPLPGNRWVDLAATERVLATCPGVDGVRLEVAAGGELVAT